MYKWIQNHSLDFPWTNKIMYPRILYFCLIMYPFQMEFHGVAEVYPWSHEMYLRIHLAILDPEPFLGAVKCIQGSVWQFWIQNHSLESQSVCYNPISNLANYFPWKSILFLWKSILFPWILLVSMESYLVSMEIHLISMEIHLVSMDPTCFYGNPN